MDEIAIPDPAMTLAQLEGWARELVNRMTDLEDTQLAVILTVTANEVDRRGGNAIAILRLVGPDAKKTRTARA